MRAALRRHVDQLDRLCRQALGSLKHSTRLAFEGKNGAVVVRVGGNLHQLDGITVEHGFLDLIDLGLISALTEIDLSH